MRRSTIMYLLRVREGLDLEVDLCKKHYLLLLCAATSIISAAISFIAFSSFPACCGCLAGLEAFGKVV